jgi:hypothetical protein
VPKSIYVYCSDSNRNLLKPSKIRVFQQFPPPECKNMLAMREDVSL